MNTYMAPNSSTKHLVSQWPLEDEHGKYIGQTLYTYCGFYIALPAYFEPAGPLEEFALDRKACRACLTAAKSEQEEA